MKRSSIVALAGLLLFVWVGGWSLAAFIWYRNVYIPAQVVRAEGFKFRFGLLKNDGSNNYSITQETTTIPMTFGDSTYGFQVVPPDSGTYTFSFVSHFPYPPKTISGDVYLSNTPGKDMPSVKAMMQGSFVEDLGFDPGDPVGEQSIDILIDGKVVKTLKFTVTAPAAVLK